MDDKTPLGPNVKALLIERASQLTVERAGSAGDDFGVACAVAGRIAEDMGSRFKSDMRDAFEWTKKAIALVRTAPDNTLNTDEEIAGEIIRRIRERKATRGVS